MASIIALADDLSGAAETAAALGLRGARNTSIRLHLTRSPVLSSGSAVVDTDTRALEPDAAAAIVSELALAARRPDRLLLKKTDSLLRGNVAAELAALHAVSPLVFLPAIPALARTVVDGRLLIDGVPLHLTALWHAEARTPPERITDLFAGVACATIGLTTVRGPRAELRAEIGRAHREKVLVIADGETDADLAAVLDAALAEGVRILAGPSSVAAVLAAAVDAAAVGAAADGPDDRSEGAPDDPDGRIEERAEEHPEEHPGVLVVVGSASAAARRQVEVLERGGVTVLRVDSGRLVAGGADFADPDLAGADLADRLAQSTDRVLAVAVTAEQVDPSRSAALATALGRAVARGAGDRSLVLTGGETARRVLDSLEVRELHTLAEIEHGAVLLQAADGRRIVTRPGSFGDDSSLASIVAALLPPHSPSSRTARLVEHHATERKLP